MQMALRPINNGNSTQKSHPVDSTQQIHGLLPSQLMVNWTPCHLPEVPFKLHRSHLVRAYRGRAMVRTFTLSMMHRHLLYYQSIPLPFPSLRQHIWPTYRPIWSMSKMMQDSCIECTQPPTHSTLLHTDTTQSQMDTGSLARTWTVIKFQICMMMMMMGMQSATLGTIIVKSKVKIARVFQMKTKSELFSLPLMTHTSS